MVFCFKQETQRLLAEPVPGITATPHEENARYFDVIVDGPKEVCRITDIILEWREADKLRLYRRSSQHPLE